MIDPKFPKKNLELFYRIQSIENDLLISINFGDALESQELYQKYIDNIIKDETNSYNLSENKVQSIKYHIVSLIVLMSNLIIKKGFSAYSVKAKAQAMIQMLDGYQEIQDLVRLGRIATKAFCAQSSKASISCENKYIRLALNYIHEHLGEKITLDDIANHVYMDKCRLCSQFKDTTGYTFSEYIAQSRIERAKILLSHSERELSYIADSLGFGSQGYFSTLFKKYTGSTPTEFRLQNKDIYMSEFNILNHNKNNSL
ncbi:MAG: AraC family transcriptional regulator [Andreesenia angusta]|nr:AraC family transcriptional regulator [Andreesenia angusta]